MIAFISIAFYLVSLWCFWDIGEAVADFLYIKRGSWRHSITSSLVLFLFLVYVVAPIMKHMSEFLTILFGN